MVLGGLPLLALSVWQQDPALSGHIQDLNINDWGALFYSSLFGSAISYGVFFYNATRGSLTKLSSLTFLTPMFATLFGYLVLDEMLSGVQLAGAVVTLVGIYMVNLKVGSETQDKVD
jgi:drug/metabolite transporter (DMT)-like permease